MLPCLLVVTPQSTLIFPIFNPKNQERDNRSPRGVIINKRSTKNIRQTESGCESREHAQRIFYLYWICQFICWTDPLFPKRAVRSNQTTEQIFNIYTHMSKTPTTNNIIARLFMDGP